MMKSSLKENEKILNIESVSSVKNTLAKPRKEKYVFHYIDNLAADHDVTVSSTMIKVTYKKTLKEHYVTGNNELELSKDSAIFEDNMNSLNKSSEFESNNLMVVPSSLKPVNTTLQVKKNIIDSSSTKQKGETQKKKKKEFTNGLNFPKSNEASMKEILGNESNHNNFLQNKMQQNSGNVLKPKVIQKSPTREIINSDENKFQSNFETFLKGVSLVKVQNSISENHVPDKKTEHKKLTLKIQINPSENCKEKKKEEKNALKRKLKPQSIIPNKKLKKTEKNSKKVKKKLLNSKIKAVARTKDFKASEINSNSSEIIEESSSKKPLLLVDPDLPSGWSRYIRTRDKGTACEKNIVYVVSPQGKKFRFKWKLRSYLEKTRSTLDPDQFFFGLYKRTKLSKVPAADEENKKESRHSLPKNNSKETSNIFKLSKSGKSDLKCLKSHPDNMLEEAYVKEGQITSDDLNKIGKNGSPDSKELLLHDPDLPFGWKRTVNCNNSSGKLQVHIISPEGRIFRRRYRLSEYLTKHQYSHSLDRFYFGLYPKKDLGDNIVDFQEDFKKSFDEIKGDFINTEPDVVIKEDGESTLGLSNVSDNDEDEDEDDDDDDDDQTFSSEKDYLKCNDVYTPMYDDPNLPEGWNRYIKIRSCGESAGRMEVVLVSPDGRRHRSKGQLDNYLRQQNLDYKAEDFDFSVFGKLKKRQVVEPNLEPEPDSEPCELDINYKKKFKWILNDNPVPALDIDSLKEVKVTPEGKMINAVNGLMINCELSSARSERRLRMPRLEHEKIIKQYFEFEDDISGGGCDVPMYWIQRLVKCRSDFRNLEPDAAFFIAEKTKDFIKELSQRAFQSSQTPEKGLQYEDVAEVVEKSQSLSPLKTLIPKKIKFKEFIRLNRPKQFLSFT